MPNFLALTLSVSLLNPFPPAQQIQQLLDARIQTIAAQQPNNIAFVVGLVSPHSRRIIASGPADGNTAFEIGSVTKVFTALLLADMAQRGEVALTDPASKYLPAAKIPERNGRPITLEDLVTHTSGLPFMTDMLPTLDAPAPSATNSTPQLYEFLSHYKLPRDPGTDWDYSNLDYWLLSEALAARAHTTYEALLRERVLAPLKLNHTAITPSPETKQNLATGNNAILEPSPQFNSVFPYADMPAAGGLISTANDLLAFLSAATDPESSPLKSAFAVLRATHRPIDQQNEQVLGWQVRRDAAGEILFHDGSTWGYASAIAWDPAHRLGVVVLSNQLANVTDLAIHLLRPNIPLEEQTSARNRQISLESGALDLLTGTYEISDEGTLLIRRAGNHLTIQLPASWGLPILTLRTESPANFFGVELPVRVLFQLDPATDRPTALKLQPPRSHRQLLATRKSPG